MYSDVKAAKVSSRSMMYLHTEHEVSLLPLPLQRTEMYEPTGHDCEQGVHA